MEHRKALHRNLAQSLFEHGQITTTLPKAKDLRAFAERLITLAKQARGGSLGARRRIHRLMSERYLIPKEHQEAYDGMSDAQRRNVRQSRSGRRHRSGASTGALPFTAQATSHRLIQEIAPRFEDRPGGYTRIIKLAQTRIGDSAAQAILQLVGEEETPSNVPRPGRSARRRRSDARYAAVMKGGRKKSKPQPAEPAKPDPGATDAPAGAPE